MKILVTGGAGHIGSNLVRRLILSGYDVFVADNLWRGKIENLKDNGRGIIDFDTRYFDVDLREYSNCLMSSRNMDIVIHLADIVAGINFVFNNQHFLYRANILMNSHMLDAAIQNKVKKYLYVGTACSYPAEKQSILNSPPLKRKRCISSKSRVLIWME